MAHRRLQSHALNILGVYTIRRAQRTSEQALRMQIFRKRSAPTFTRLLLYLGFEAPATGTAWLGFPVHTGWVETSTLGRSLFCKSPGCLAAKAGPSTLQCQPLNLETLKRKKPRASDSRLRQSTHILKSETPWPRTLQKEIS